MTFDEIYSDIELLPGWMGKADAAVIFRLATQTVGTIVEIGSYAGKTTRLLALSSPESHIITIDSWAMGKMDKEFNEAVFFRHTFYSL